MMQDPPTGGVAVHPSTMGQQQQQQHQPQSTTTTNTADQEEEEEEKKFRKLWIEGLQNWMDKVEEEKKVRTLWIGDLQPWMDEAYILGCFAHTGGEEVFTSEIIRIKKTTTECYGFIEFKSHAFAARFLNKFHGSFNLNWASSSSSFGSGGEKQRQEEEEEEEEEEEDDCAADDLTISVVGDDADLAAASDIVSTDFMLPQETFTSVKRLDCVAEFYYGVYSSWEDMLIWWRITRGTHTRQAVRAAHRVYMIGAIFKNPYFGPPPETVTEASLDELAQYVDIFDIAKELHSIDALDDIFGELYNENAGIRAKAVNLINTIAKKNHCCWQLINEASRRGLIYHTYFNGRDPNVQSIALDAISSLFSIDKPGISAFGQKGYADLINYVFKNGCVNRQRKALDLIARLVGEHNSDYNIVIELEYPSIMMRLATSVDAELRKAAFKCLIVLASVEKGENSGQVVKNDDKLKKILQERLEGIKAMAPEDLAAVSDEKDLLDLLWNACHN